jgi:hypothetical protein
MPSRPAELPSCKSITNLSELYPATIGGYQGSMPGVVCAQYDWMGADLNGAEVT